MTEDPRTLLDALASLEKEVTEESPALGQILADARDKKIEVTEAVRWIMQISEEDPKARAALEKAAEKLPEPQLSTHNPTNKLPRINPLVEAGLIERAQLDGDMPELRSGPILKGQLPSVPVDTTARNPVVVGRMLAAAALETQTQLDTHERKRLQGITADPAVLKVMADHGMAVVKPDVALDIAKFGNVGTDLSGYRRGQLPALAKTAKPSGAELAVLNRKETQEATWAAVATSQGRRSVSPVIRDGIIQALTRLGFDVTPRDPVEGNETSCALATWAVDISGRESLSPNFSFFDIAAMALASDLVDKLQDKAPRPLILEVAPMHQINERTVGWCGRLYESSP